MIWLYDSFEGGGLPAAHDGAQAPQVSIHYQDSDDTVNTSTNVLSGISCTSMSLNELKALRVASFKVK